MLSFEQVLSKVAADAAGEEWPFREGDSAHLKRWLEDWRAAAIWGELYQGAFDRIQAHQFIILILTLRQLAEHLDRANQQVSDAKRGRKKASAADVIKLIREMSAQGVVITDVRDGALDSVENLEPFLANRERGTRRRTWFADWPQIISWLRRGAGMTRKLPRCAKSL